MKKIYNNFISINYQTLKNLGFVHPLLISILISTLLDFSRRKTIVYVADGKIKNAFRQFWLSARPKRDNLCEREKLLAWEQNEPWQTNWDWSLFSCLERKSSRTSFDPSIVHVVANNIIVPGISKKVSVFNLI